MLFVLVHRQGTLWDDAEETLTRTELDRRDSGRFTERNLMEASPAFDSNKCSAYPQAMDGRVGLASYRIP